MEVHYQRNSFWTTVAVSRRLSRSARFTKACWEECFAYSFIIAQIARNSQTREIMRALCKHGDEGWICSSLFACFLICQSANEMSKSSARDHQHFFIAFVDLLHFHFRETYPCWISRLGTYKYVKRPKKKQTNKQTNKQTKKTLHCVTHSLMWKWGWSAKKSFSRVWGVNERTDRGTSPESQKSRPLRWQEQSWKEKPLQVVLHIPGVFWSWQISWHINAPVPAVHLAVRLLVAADGLNILSAIEQDLWKAAMKLHSDQQKSMAGLWMVICLIHQISFVGGGWKNRN